MATTPDCDGVRLVNPFHNERVKVFDIGGSFTAWVIFLGGLAGQ